MIFDRIFCFNDILGKIKAYSQIPHHIRKLLGLFLLVLQDNEDLSLVQSFKLLGQPIQSVRLNGSRIGFNFQINLVVAFYELISI